MTRRKSLAERQPNGQIKRQPKLPPPVEIYRLREAAIAGMRDASWGTSIGRLYLAEQITASQFAAGRKWTALVNEYSAVCQSPKTPSTAKLDPDGGTPIDPDSPLGIREARRHEKTIGAYLAAAMALRLSGASQAAAVKDICENNLHPVGMAQLTALRGGLTILASLWGRTHTTP